MESRILTEAEIAICVWNCKSYAYDFKAIRGKCANPQCKYPLSALTENFYSHEVSGKVCDLCHTMEDAVRQQTGLRAAHENWKKEQESKKKILDNNRYL